MVLVTSGDMNRLEKFGKQSLSGEDKDVLVLPCVFNHPEKSDKTFFKILSNYCHRFMIRCRIHDGLYQWEAVPMGEDTTITHIQCLEDVIE